MFSQFFFQFSCRSTYPFSPKKGPQTLGELHWTRAIDGDIVVVEKLEDAEALERADKRLRRELPDPDFGKSDAQPSTTDAGTFLTEKGGLKMFFGCGMWQHIEF